MPKHSIIYFVKKIYTWFLAYHCILCGNHSTRAQDLCANCYHDLPTIQYACPCCARVYQSNLNHLRCGNCLKKLPPFDNTYALYLYQKPITHLVMNLKFHHALVNAQVLGELLTEKIRHNWYKTKPLPEAIFPVPLHTTRLKERGFNQAIEIARPIARTLKLPIDSTTCIRSKTTLPQATLSATERIHNIKNAFQITRSIPYQHIAVIDDVITTGHTVKEFCRVLKKAGVRQIDVWCCARPFLYD